MTWTNIYVPAKRESVKRWGLALVIIMSLVDCTSQTPIILVDACKDFV